MDTKRILFVTQLYPSSATGGTLKSRRLIEYLGTECGHVIDVCCVEFPHMVNDILSLPRVRIYSVIKETRDRKSVAYYLRLFQDFFQCKPFFVARVYDKKMSDNICILLQTHAYDEVILDGFSSLQYARVFKQPVLYSEINDMTRLSWNRARSCRGIGRKVLFFIEWCKCLLFERIQLKLIHTIWAIREASVVRLQKITRAKIHIIPVTIPVYPNVFHISSKHIVFSGLLHWAENADGIRWFLETCWNKVHARFPDTMLYITGQLADKSVLNKFEKFPNVIYCGHIQKLSHIYRTCACAITPVFIDDGVKMKTLAYIGHGLPVVSGVESAKGMTSSDGVVLSTRINFTNSVIRVLRQGAYRKLLSKKGYLNATKNYSFKKFKSFFANDDNWTS